MDQRLWEKQVTEKDGYFETNTYIFVRQWRYRIATFD